MYSSSVHRSSIPPLAIKGRGSASHLAHRFEREARERFDDGWDLPGGETPAFQPEPVATEVRFEDAKSALSRNSSPDIHFDRSLNPYRGCEHGCIYCYARPTHSYLNLSPGLDFETRLIAKRNISGLLRGELARRSYAPAEIAIGTVTDAYQPVERELKLTRGVIEVLSEFHHPFAVITKASLVERDLDLIAPMAAQGLAAVYITVTTLDAALSRKLEPRAAAPLRRLRTIRTLAQAGVPVGVSVAPQIPFVNEDMEQVLEAAWDAGARSAFYTVLRLPWEVAPLFREWLQLHYPQRAQRIMARVQDMRAGQDYHADFATRMKGEGVWADLIRQRFHKTTRRLGFDSRRVMLDARAFRASCPVDAGQRELF